MDGPVEAFCGCLGIVHHHTTPVGIFLQPNDNNRGITAIGTGADGNDLVDYFAATPTPSSSITINQGETKNFVWNVTQLVKDWLANPGAATYGKFIIVPGARIDRPEWPGIA